MTIAPGIHDIRREDYDRDPCPAPSLNASTAKLLLTASPRHAWTRHTRLNPFHERETSRRFDIGSAAHAILLGDDHSVVEVIAAEDYRSKAAQAAREAAIAAGRLPLLEHEHAAVMGMVGAAREQLSRHEASDAFTRGRPEQTLIWREGPTWCRARLDWLPDELDGDVTLYDLKTTAGSAHPDVWIRRLYDMAGDIQPAFYMRGLRRLWGGIRKIRFRFVVVETEPPHALSVCELDPYAIAMADERVDEALRIWRECLEADRWPAYPPMVATCAMPAYADMRWQEAKQRREQIPIAIKTLAMEMQAP